MTRSRKEREENDEKERKIEGSRHLTSNFSRQFLSFSTLLLFSRKFRKYPGKYKLKIVSFSSRSQSVSNFPAVFFIFNSSAFHMFLLIRRYLPTCSVYSRNCSTSKEIKKAVGCEKIFYHIIKAAMTDTKKVRIINNIFRCGSEKSF